MGHELTPRFAAILLIIIFLVHPAYAQVGESQEDANPEVDALIKKGHQQFQNEEYEQSLATFLDGIEKYPQEYLLYAYAALAHEELGDMESMLSYADQSLSINDSDLTVHGVKARALRNLERYGEAIEVLEYCLENGSDNPNYLYFLGDCHMELEQYDSAISYFQQYVQLAPDAAKAWRYLGTCLVETKRYEEAVQALETAIEAGSESVWARYNLGYAHYFLGNNDEAITQFSILTRENPDRDLFHYWLGRAQRSSGDLQAALASFTRAVELDSEWGSAQFYLGKVMQQLGMYEDSITHIEKALALGFDNAEAYQYLGLSLVGLGRVDEAEEAMLTAIERDPDSVDLYVGLGTMYMRAVKPYSAEQAIQKALELDPGNQLNEILLGSTYIMQYEGQKAIDLMNKVIAEAPADVYPLILGMAYMNLGLGLMIEERYEEALEICPQVLKYGSDDPRLTAIAAVIYSKNSMFDEALSLAETTLVIDPNNAMAYAVIGTAKYYEDDHEAAVRAFRHFIDLGRTDMMSTLTVYKYLTWMGEAELATELADMTKENPLFSRIMKTMEDGWVNDFNEGGQPE